MASDIIERWKATAY